MVKAFIVVAFSLFCVGAFYAGWLAVFLLTAGAHSPVAHATRWLSAPLVTAAGFAAGIAISERLTKVRKTRFFRILLWPLIGCALGAGAVYWFGPMLIVFAMFAAGTASVILRAVLLCTRGAKNRTDGQTEENDDYGSCP